MTDEIPQTPVEPVKRSLLQRVSIVWVVPLVALAIALGIAWQAYQERGALIEIYFAKASGIVAEQTQVRYREVSVGVVEKVTFSPDLSRVIAHVRLDKDVEPFVDSEALFWVVQPQVTARGVSGLETVLSGVYIEGSWDATPGGLQRRFEGLEERPVARPDQKGTRIVLSSNTGKGLSEGAPILYKGLEVGRVGRPTLSSDGVTITSDAFIAAPHDKLLTTRSRFWDTSGISLNMGAGGISVDVESVASLISGGISFETVVSGGELAGDGDVFAVFGNKDDARESLFEGNRPEGGTMEMAMIFDQNVAGLSVGAPVLLDGLPIGEVVGLTGRVDKEQFGDDRVRLVVVLSIDFSQLDAAPEADTPEEEREAILDLLESAVAEGWRARLARGSLLTGALKIEMVKVADAEPAEFVRDGDPYPIFPSVEADLQGVNASAEGLLKRVGELPIEDLLASAQAVLDNAAALIANKDTQQIPSDIRGAVAEVRGVIGSAEFQALPERINGVADELLAAMEDLRSREGVAKLVDAVENAGAAAAEIATAAEGVPALVERIEAVAAKAESLDLEGLLAQGETMLASAGDILGTDAAKALPDTLAQALDGVDAAVAQASAMLGDLNEAGAATKLTETIDTVNAVVADLGTAVEGVPGLLEQVQAVAAKADGLDLEGLVTEARGLTANAREILAGEAAKALPDTLTDALDGVDAAVAEATALLGDMNEAGAAQQLSEAIGNVNAAAADIGTAVEGLPDLIEQIRAVAAKAEAMDIDQFVEEVNGLLASADAVIGTDEARALPGSLRAALDEVAGTLDDLREGGTVESVNSALASTEVAADAIAQASTELPELVRKTEAVLREAELALAGLSDSGALNREARATLREVTRAAESVRSLARTLERKPNALLTGK